MRTKPTPTPLGNPKRLHLGSNVQLFGGRGDVEGENGVMEISLGSGINRSVEEYSKDVKITDFSYKKALNWLSKIAQKCQQAF